MVCWVLSGKSEKKESTPGIQRDTYIVVNSNSSTAL